MGNSSSNIQLSQEEFEQIRELTAIAKRQQEQIKELTIRKHALELYLMLKYGDSEMYSYDK